MADKAETDKQALESRASGSSMSVMSEKDIPPKMVKCITCGFAAKRTLRPTAEHPNRFVLEISARERHDGVEFPGFKAMLDSPHGPTSVGTELFCSRGVVNLGALVREQVHASGGAAAAAMVVLQEDRRCGESCKHIDGLAPKDHLDKLMFEQLSTRIENDRKEFMRELEEQRKAFDIKMAERAEQFHREISGIGTKLMWAAVILGLFQVIASFFAMTPDARLERWIHPKTETVQPVARPTESEPSSPQ